MSREYTFEEYLDMLTSKRKSDIGLVGAVNRHQFEEAKRRSSGEARVFDVGGVKVKFSGSLIVLSDSHGWSKWCHYPPELTDFFEDAFGDGSHAEDVNDYIREAGKGTPAEHGKYEEYKPLFRLSGTIKV